MNFNLSLPNDQAKKFKLQKLFTNWTVKTQVDSYVHFEITVQNDVDFLNFYTATWSCGYNMCYDVVRASKSSDVKPVQI